MVDTAIIIVKCVCISSLVEIAVVVAAVAVSAMFPVVATAIALAIEVVVVDGAKLRLWF